MRNGTLPKEIKSPKPNLLIDASEQASQTIVLAHGAGAGMDSEFMKSMAEGLAGC
jgi:predicted alpha/beta-hydrolase family hydrolase